MALTNKAPWFPQMSRDKAEEGWEEEERGKKRSGSNPQSQGTLKCLQMECKEERRANSIWLPRSTAQRAGFTNPGRTFGRKGNSKAPLTERTPTPAG